MSGLIARLIEAGTPADLIEEVALALARAEALRELVETRRAKDRDRKRIPRKSTETEESAEIQGTVSLDKKAPDPKKLIPSVCVNDSSPRARGYHRLPEGWTPTRPLPANTQAKADQWPPGALDDELAALHRWAVNAKNEAGKGRKLDWDKAWVNWIERRHDERYGRTNGIRGTGASEDGLSATARAAISVFGSAPPGH